MTKILRPLISCICMLFLLFGCQNEPNPENTEAPTEKSQTTQTTQTTQTKESKAKGLFQEENGTQESDRMAATESIPHAPNGMPLEVSDQEKESRKGILKGKWASVSNPNHHVEFTGTEFKEYNSGKIVSSTTYQISLPCNDEPCQASGQPVRIGWCFSTENNCYVIKRVDEKNLVYKSVDASSFVAFRKLKL